VKGNKFFARKSACNAGHTHASRAEALRCNDLQFLERSGKISGLQVEPKFQFHANGRPIKMGNGAVASYRPDFLYTEAGKQVAEDVKGGPTQTEAAALRMALFRTCYPEIELRIIK